MCHNQGNVLKCDGNPDNFLYKHTPITLTPIPYPVHLYEQALAYETSMGVFFSQLSKKHQLMRGIIQS